MWEGKEGSRQDRAMMMWGSQRHRDEAWICGEKMAGLWTTGEHHSEITRKTDKVGTSTDLGTSVSESKGDGLCTHGPVKTEMQLTAAGSSKPRATHQRRKGKMFPPGQGHD